MKVRDYVRTKKGMIAKIMNKQDINGGLHNKEEVFILDNGNRLAINSCKVIKSSPNIIDLIEVGDYVNGHKVFDDMRVDTDDYGNDFIEIGIEIDNMLNHYIREEDIKSIVTHEQFESMQYNLESEVN